MTEQELRAIVREAIAAAAPVRPPSPAASARLAEAREASVGGSDRPSTASSGSDRPLTALRPARTGTHSSHAMFPVPSGADADGPCVIEPTVMCNHCGYCKSYGH